MRELSNGYPFGVPTKRAKKTPSKTPRRPGKNGGELLTGNPGNAGGTGRPPNWLREWCDNLLASPDSKRQVEEILKDKNHSAFATMWRTISERAHGKPAQAFEVSGDITVTLEQVLTQMAKDSK